MTAIINWLMNTRAARWVALAFAFLLAWLGYGYSKQAQGRREGREEAEADQREAALKAMETRRDVESTVRNSGDGTAADRLRETWSRD